MHVRRFENINADFKEVCSLIGGKYDGIELSHHKKKTKHKHFREYYDLEMRKKVEFLY